MLRRNQTRATLRNIADMLADRPAEHQAVTELLRELEAIPAGDMLASEWLGCTGVETPCHVCRGSGRRSYSNGSTWRRGVGTCSFEPDVCDHCWGSGDEREHFEDRRKTEERWREKVRTATLDSWLLGFVDTADRQGVIQIATEALRKPLNRRKDPLNFWQQRMIEYLIARIEQLGGKVDDDG
jgi:hypothetical protein